METHATKRKNWSTMLKHALKDLSKTDIDEYDGIALHWESLLQVQLAAY